ILPGNNPNRRPRYGPWVPYQANQEPPDGTGGSKPRKSSPSALKYVWRPNRVQTTRTEKPHCPQPGRVPDPSPGPSRANPVMFSSRKPGPSAGLTGRPGYPLGSCVRGDGSRGCQFSAFGARGGPWD